MYFLFSSFIPSHPPLMSNSLEIDSSTLFFLSSFLALVNSLLSCRNSCGFLSLAACLLLSKVSCDFYESSNLLFLSFGFDFGSVSIPCFSQVLMVLYLFCWCSPAVLRFCKEGIVFQSS